MALFFLALWGPVLCLVLITIRLQTIHVAGLRAQRSADRCLYGRLSARCHSLSTLSILNQRLRTLAEAALSAQAAQRVPPLAPAATVALKAIQTQARLTALQQDHLLLTDAALSATTLICGLPLEAPLPFLQTMERKPWLPAEMAKTPSPLAWKAQPRATPPAWVHLRAWSGVVIYGGCSSPKKEDLRGERYDASFRWRNDVGKRSWSPFWSWSR